MNKKKNVDVDKIIEMYNNGLTLKNISDHFGFKSYGPIRNVLLENGFNLKLRIGSNNRLRKLDESFFDNIDSEEKAYILGWIISDGYVNDYKLSFCIKDLDILELIKCSIKSEHKIINSIYYDKRTEKKYQRYILQITSKKLVKSLNLLGVTQNKSFIVKLPKISMDLRRHLLRGIFDGDGYIGIGTKNSIKYPRFSIIITQNMYYDIEEIFNSIGVKLLKSYLVAEKNGDKVLKIHIYRKEDLIKIYHFLYDDCSLKLERKYNKYKSSIE